MGSKISDTFGKNLQVVSARLKRDSSVSASIPPKASSHKSSFGATSSLCSAPKFQSQSLISAAVESEGFGVLDGELGWGLFSSWSICSVSSLLWSAALKPVVKKSRCFLGTAFWVCF